jgi:hypothetical protein
MSRDESRSVARNIDIRCDDASAIAAHDLHCDARAALQAAANITAIPSHAERDLRVNTDSRKNRTGILHAGGAGGSEHGEARDSDELEGHEEHTSFADAVGVPRRGDGEEAGADVGRDAHELGFVGRVAHVFDDGGQEQGEGVDGAEAGHADEHEDVDFPVGERLVDVFHVEVVGEVARVFI